MLNRTLARLLVLVLLSTALLADSVSAAGSCPGVDRLRTKSGSWTTDLIRDGSGHPLLADVTADTIGGGITVEYFDGQAWHTMSQGVTVSASAVRYTTGEAQFHLVSGACTDDWSNNEEE